MIKCFIMIIITGSFSKVLSCMSFKKTTSRNFKEFLLIVWFPSRNVFFLKPAPCSLIITHLTVIDSEYFFVPRPLNIGSRLCPNTVPSPVLVFYGLEPKVVGSGTSIQVLCARSQVNISRYAARNFCLFPKNKFLLKKFDFDKSSPAMVPVFRLYEHVLFLNYPKLPKHVHKCLYAKLKKKQQLLLKYKQ